MSEGSILLYENKSERVSGRSWKDTPDLKSRLQKKVVGKKKSYEERVRERKEIQRIRGIELAEKEERAKARREAKERKRQKQQAKMSREILSSGVQVITRTDKIKNWNKKARRMLRKVSLESLNLK
ncbi:hypothetical protein OIY81_2083 [Cryptosporidium canis]|uniref:Coiled-coil domain-containing protein 86 n=1 Tax=Cryptosporidium canis TaxID=195482 RepID=A0A9D5DHG4_9CRYT|nr:hypothetical protein OJ253_2884 [Cryptosporidium canis]KAJ1610283.1 hypothetical protein OIY81_2083 [Cryptosporidium canis]KAJ1615545.1 hypothetical protein OJ252_8 [Cryptosporidium canis]